VKWTMRWGEEGEKARGLRADKKVECEKTRRNIAPSHIGGCRTNFAFAVAEWPKIGEAGGEVSEPKRTSRGRVKRVATVPASFVSGAIPPTCTRSYPGMSSLRTAEGDKRGLYVISRDVMSSEPAAGDKRSALDAPDTDDDDGCAEQGEGAGAAGHKPEQAGTRNKKVRRNGDARNLSQQQREERQAVMAIIRQIEEMEYKEQAAKAGAWSTGLEGRVGHASGKVGEKRHFGDACDTGWGEAAEEGPRGEGGGTGGEKLKDKRQKETNQTQAARGSRQGKRGGCGEEKAFFVRGSGHGREGKRGHSAGRSSPPHNQ
jgi:hypothetical protein